MNSLVAFTLVKKKKKKKIKPQKPPKPEICSCMNGTGISSMGFQGKPVLNQPSYGLVMCYFRALVENRNCRAANLL